MDLTAKKVFKEIKDFLEFLEKMRHRPYTEILEKMALLVLKEKKDQ